MLKDSPNPVIDPISDGIEPVSWLNFKSSVAVGQKIKRESVWESQYQYTKQ